MRALAMAVLGESSSPTPPTPTYPTESIVYVAEADSNGNLYIPTSGRGQSTSTYMPYSWNVSIDGGTPTQYSGTSSTAVSTRKITLSGYTAGTRHTIQITPVTEDYQWARAFGVYQSETASIPATIKEILYDGSEKGFAISSTQTGDYYRYYQWALTGIISAYPETLPNAIMTIGTYFRGNQYKGCTSLTTPATEAIPNTVLSIGHDFRYGQYLNCTGLTTTAAEVISDNVNIIDNYFRGSQYAGCTSLTTPAVEVLPSGVISIGTYFRASQYNGCTQLTTPAAEVVPNGVTSIGNYFRQSQYRGCTSLTAPATEVVPSGVTSIGNYFRSNLYNGCTQLTTPAVEIVPNSVTSIGTYFRTSIYLNCTSLTTPAAEVFPSTMTSIGNYFRSYQYSGCTSLTTTAVEVLPNTITSIGTYFRSNQYGGCTSLTAAATEVFNDSVTSVGNLFRFHQYDGCTSLTTVGDEVFTNGVTSIGTSFRAYQFQNCIRLTQTAKECLPDSVTSVGNYFRQYQYCFCERLTSITGLKDCSTVGADCRYLQFAYCPVSTIKTLGDVGASYDASITYSNITRVEVPNAYLSNYVNTTNNPRASIADSAFVGYSQQWTPGANTLVYYNISNNDTNSTIYDLSGKGNNLSGTIGYYTDTTVGKCFNTGRPTHSIINFGNEFTFISRVYYVSASGMHCIFSNGAGSSSYASNGLDVNYYSDQKLDGWSKGVVNLGGDADIRSDITVPSSAWTMCAYTRDSSGKMRIYINNTVKEISSSHTPVYPSGTTFMLGGWGGGGNNWNGYIKVLIGENRFWATSEITDYYNQTKSNYGIG